MKSSRSRQELQKIRDGILDSALNIIVTEGFHALTMRRLAKTVGMTAPNLYNYFPNKDEIYITLMIKGFKDLSAVLSAELEKYSDPVSRTKAVVLAYLKFGTENSRYYDIMFSSSSPKYLDYIGTQHEALSTKEHNVSMQLIELVVKLVQDLAASLDCAISETKAKLALTAIWSLLHGMVSLRNSHNIDYLIDDPESIYQQIIVLLVTEINRFFEHR